MSAALLGVICGLVGFAMAANDANWFAAFGWAVAAAWAVVSILQDKLIAALRKLISDYAKYMVFKE
jgi:hypothetical protein